MVMKSVAPEDEPTTDRSFLEYQKKHTQQRVKSNCRRSGTPVSILKFYKKGYITEKEALDLLDWFTMNFGTNWRGEKEKALQERKLLGRN